MASSDLTRQDRLIKDSVVISVCIKTETMKESESISAAIKALRSRLGETQAGMARLLGASGTL
jgi:hypothetical protein